MTAEAAGVLDTSVFIASEVGQPLGELPRQVTVSVLTIGELELGVLNAADNFIKARRADTLAMAQSIDPVPINESIARAWARLVRDCRSAGIHRTVKLVDSLIAATAVDLGLPVVSHDEDYNQIAQAHPLLRVVMV